MGGGKINSTSTETNYNYADYSQNDGQTGKTEKQSDQTTKPADYIVKRGDTLTEIAVKTGQNLQQLRRENPQIKNPNKIYVGQHLNLGSGAGKSCTVKSGDTLAKIAEGNHTTVGDILRANPGQINNRNLIYPGQKLHLPVHKTNAAVSKPKTIVNTQHPVNKPPIKSVPNKPQTPVNANPNKPQSPVSANPTVKPVDNQSSTKSLHLKFKSKDIQLSPLVQRKMSQIADEYYKKTGKDLVITDGNRTPHEQAERIYDKILKGGEGIYTNKKALAEIKAAYNEGLKRGESREQIVSRMTQTIQNQAKQGVYISKHLIGQGADVQIKLMTSADRTAYLEAVAKVGGARKLDEGDHWHMEISADGRNQVSQPPTNPIILTSKPTPPVEPTFNQPAGNLKLGANEEYRDALQLAQKRTGIDAATMASVINAEAAVNHQTGKWIASSQAGTSSARGLTQFTAPTWEIRAGVKGSYLHQIALERGLISEANGRTVIINHQGLLALRDDPTVSVVTGAEYGKDNLASLEQMGLIPKNLTNDERAKYLYYAHHEGLAGAALHLTDSRTASPESAKAVLTLFFNTNTECLKIQYGSYTEAYKHFAENQARKNFPVQVGKSGGAIIDAYVKKYGNYEQGYHAWLNDYADKKIQPGKYHQ